MNLHRLMLDVHVVTGGLAFLLGFVVLLLPKFGHRAKAHRILGRVYAACMLVMSVLSIPLALQGKSTLLLVIGVLSLLWIGGGWYSVLRFRVHKTYAYLRWHIILMGISYISAWTAFLVNIQPLGGGQILFLVYALGPGIIGGFFIGKNARRIKAQFAARALVNPYAGKDGQGQVGAV